MIQSQKVNNKVDLRSLLNHLQHLTLELIKAENRVFLASAQCIPNDSADVFKEFNESLALEERLREERQQVVAEIRSRLTQDRKSTRLNSSHQCGSRMPSSA